MGFGEGSARQAGCTIRPSDRPGVPLHMVWKNLRSLLIESRYRLVALFVSLYMVVWLLTRLGLLLVQHAFARTASARRSRRWPWARCSTPSRRCGWRCRWCSISRCCPSAGSGRGDQRVLLWWPGGRRFSALFTAAAEYYFFDEFNGRFNFVAVDYLIYPTEVVDNVWQSYHTGIVLTS